MKLQTAIPARRDGTVIVQGLDGQRYVFTKDQDNELSCDVTDDATVAHLLAGKNFWPADERDAEAALKLLDAADDSDGDADFDDDDDGADADGLPQEANTPPQRIAKPGRKPRKAATPDAG